MTLEILLVEDNPRDVELTLRAFEVHKLVNHITVARDGVEALDVLQGRTQPDGGGQPAVVLLDLKLPRLDGLDVLRAIRSDDRLRTLPVVVLTSFREERDLVESYELGVNSYIVKPVDFDKFTETARVLGLYWVLTNERTALVPSGT